MNKKFIYKALKNYFAKKYSIFIKMKNAKKVESAEDVNEYIREFMREIYDVGMFTQYLGLSHEEVDELYSFYQEKFLAYKKNK